MKKNLQLYIGEMMADIADDFSLSMIYQTEDLTNPTIVKNSFSKTVTLRGTKQNNKIFGEIYKTNRKQVTRDDVYSGVFFNPSKRTPFSIIINGEMVESGYMQLNSVVIKNNDITYNITLFGGLGDFFYNLMYNENGEQRKLSDLRYFVENDGALLPADTEMDFNINKEIVFDCFMSPLMDDGGLQSFITFVPSYNGLYENFDNESVIINAQQSNIFNDTYKEVDGTTYEAYNGYAVASLNKAYTEWEMRDLRSYMQRPAIRLNKLVKTICNPANNGGYEVVLDEDFFNTSNPYWEKTFVALPLLNTIIESDEETTSTYLQPHPTTPYELPNNGEKYYSSPLQVVPTDGVVFDGLNKIINLEDLGDGFKKLDFTVNYGLNLQPQVGTSSLRDKYYIGYNQYVGNFGVEPVKQYIDVWVTVTDENDNVLWQSKTNRHLPTSGRFQKQEPTGNNLIGYFQNMDGQYYWVDSGTTNNVFSVECENVNVDSNFIKIKLNTDAGTLTLYNNSLLVHNGNNVGYWNQEQGATQATISTIIPNSQINFTKLEGVLSNTYITKEKLLKSQYTPADYLLSYCKMFGLFFVKDVHSKTIHIMPRNKFFNGEIEDWSNRIDYSKDFKIEPLVFNSKFYRMNCETPDTYFSKKYQTEHKLEYGQQRIDTNFNFNNETKDLLSDNVYENIVTARDYSQYFRTFRNKNGVEVPGWIADGCTYKLVNFNGDTINSEYEIDYRGSDFIDLSKTADWNSNGGYDLFPKVCCYESDKDEKNLSDINNSLLFYNGNVPLRDMNNQPVYYWVTDNIQEMYTLNDEPCWLYTESPYSPLGDTIALMTASLPQYTRMAIQDNYVTSSLDFGQPKELYVPELNYAEDKTLYSRYWKNFLNDQFDIDTKKVTAYVRMDDIISVNQNLLRKFYYFGDCIWMLNKIDGYNVMSDATVKCEFIKINDTNNYTQGQVVINASIEVTPNFVELESSGGTYTFKVKSSIPWNVVVYSTDKITDISTLSGEAGETNVTITYTENDSVDIANFYVSVAMVGSVDSVAIDFVQKPAETNVIKVYGIITNSNNGEVLPSARVLTYDDNNSYINIAYANDEGYYEIYAAKNQPYYVEVQYDIEYGDDRVYKQLQPASATNVQLNIAVDIPVAGENTGTGTYIFHLTGSGANDSNYHLITNGNVETDVPAPMYNVDVMYGNEGLYLTMNNGEVIVNDVNTFDGVSVPIGQDIYWWFYDGDNEEWRLLEIITVEDLDGGSADYAATV